MAVMGVKAGTKSWGDSTGNEITKSDKINTNSAIDKAGLGEENVGDLLNKIVDPNWVDPSKKVRTTGNDKMDKDSFMKLMLAQMKHQDPSNPMQSHELAAQLAQFSSVEQLQNVNTTLTRMEAGQKPTESFQALNFIGKAVSGDSSKVTRMKGDKSHDFSYTLPDNAKEAVVRIRNSSGETVRSINLKDLKKGENSYTWNGQDERGASLPTGDYQMFLEATSATGAKLAAKTDFEGTITGINYTAEGPVLLVGNQSIKLKDVKKIVDPSLMKNGQIVNKVSGQDLKNNKVTSQTKEKVADEDKGAQEPSLATASNLIDNVGMSRDMMAKLEKETKPDSMKPDSKPAPQTGPTQMKPQSPNRPSTTSEKGSNLR
jgi:flagellar basal-body rod modification protein FlgD